MTLPVAHPLFWGLQSGVKHAISPKPGPWQERERGDGLGAYLLRLLLPWSGAGHCTGKTETQKGIKVVDYANGKDTHAALRHHTAFQATEHHTQSCQGVLTFYS